MKLLKASKVDFHFPVLGFSRHDGMLGFDDLQTMSRCHSALIERQAFIGMELVDNHLNRWFVQSLDIAGNPPAKKRWWQIFKSEPWPEFDLELESATPIGLDELKRRFIDGTELEEPGEERALRAAPDLATMIEESNMQCSGFL